MSYIEGFLAAVPTANKQAYAEHATGAVPLFKNLGAARMVEGWGDDVPHGETNDLHGAVKAKDDETVIFSWIEYPDKAARDAANAGMQNDAGFAEMPEMPFDGSGMIWSGFETIHDQGTGAKPGYIDGVIVPVPANQKDAYLAFARKSAAAFAENGATRVVEGWGDDLMEGTQTDYRKAALLEDGETVVFSWIEWPDKATRDTAWGNLMQDNRLSDERVFDGKRMMFGGFEPILDA